MLPLPPATQALLLANVAMFFLGDLLAPGLLSPLALYPVGAGFWPWQIGTYAFLHGSFNHLFFNMLGLWMFGGELEHVWGQRRFLQFYAASVVAAALTQLLVNALLGSNLPTVGASGGLFGLLLAFAMIFPNRVILLFFVIPMKAKYLSPSTG
jgi:membrane associated rhomboid family serine protease